MTERVLFVLTDHPTPLITLEDVSKVYKTQAGDFPALKSINLSFGTGEFVSIMGKSGSGKSTLINMVTGIDHPTAGKVVVGETDITRMREGKLAVWRGRTLGVVFQFFQLLPTLTVLENILLPMDLCHVVAAAERERRALDILGRLGLEEMADKYPAALAGGQQQIAAIARALANDPPILVADEPTGNLDSGTAGNIMEIFAALAEAGKTILIVTHDASLAERTQRRVRIADGELINEFIAQALPMLSYPEMLRVTKNASHHCFEPGSPIPLGLGLEHGGDDPGGDDPGAGLFLVTQGQVEVLRKSGWNADEPVTQLSAGLEFNRLDMDELRLASLEFRAWLHGPVELLWLSGRALKQLLVEAPRAASAIGEAALVRRLQPQLIENREPRSWEPRRHV